MFKKYSIKKRVWFAVFEVVAGFFITVLIISIMSFSFLRLNIVISYNVGEQYHFEDKKTKKQLISYIESLGLDYVIFDNKINKIIKSKYISKELPLYREVLKEKNNLILNNVHYDLYSNNDYSIVIRYNEMPEFSNHHFRNISYNILTFYFLGIGIVISILVALTRFVKEISLNFKEIEKIANKMGIDRLLKQENYSKIIEFDDILKTLHVKGDGLKNLIEREKLEKQDLSFQIAALSHDIKTPLTVLKGNLELLELTSLTAKQQCYALSMDNSVSVFESYFNSLISYTRMLSEDRVAKLIVVEKLLNDLHFEMDDLLAINDVDYSLSNQLVSTSFYGDEEHLVRAISNLLVNAIRFTPVANKKIEVTLSESKTLIYFEVWNNGPQFNKNTLKNGSKLFYTEDNSRGSKHYGIGLAFVNGVATKHGGKFQLMNSTRGGASAILSIKKKSI
ncbi:sensor histidine kinase [Streptococcus uberis]|uniref:sensor histidine kinase n=1 Tax=Streptococcus uberis TaxID=1349 RepID=UPI001FF246B6|nr:HAMP domain-containing sensor histidine kinase [Streptococcus uberis]MCK1168302.1 HAMP domain-containing histidine kinase [Streptococcus uberis]MCK1187250.1 HAMP domain-containing histidine kinase [Streptococcus uberis]